jgi:hypothetical protein
MVKSVNLGLKVKVLGPLLPIRGWGSSLYDKAILVGVTVGWVGGPASLQALYIINKRRGERAAKRAQPTLE